MKNPCDGPAGDRLGFNKSAIIAILFVEALPQSPDTAGQPRLMVATVSCHGTASKRAKSPVGPALLENRCE